MMILGEHYDEYFGLDKIMHNALEIWLSKEGEEE